MRLSSLTHPFRRLNKYPSLRDNGHCHIRVCSIAYEAARRDYEEYRSVLLVRPIFVLIMPVPNHKAGPLWPALLIQEICAVMPSEDRICNPRPELELVDWRENKR